MKPWERQDTKNKTKRDGAAARPEWRPTEHKTTAAVGEKMRRCSCSGLGWLGWGLGLREKDLVVYQMLKKKRWRLRPGGVGK